MQGQNKLLEGLDVHGKLPTKLADWKGVNSLASGGVMVNKLRDAVLSNGTRIIDLLRTWDQVCASYACACMRALPAVRAACCWLLRCDVVRSCCTVARSSACASLRMRRADRRVCMHAPLRRAACVRQSSL